MRRILATAGLALAIGAAQPALAADNLGPGYVLGPDDTIQVTVFGQQDAGITTRIKADGTITMPLIGSIKAAGQTNITLAKLISDKLTQANLYKNPIVNVEIGQYVSRRVNVAGRVNTPGVYPLDRDYHALEMLLRAGWVRGDNGATYVYLRRAGGQEIRLDAEQLTRGAGDKDPLLQPGDTLFVPEADNYFIYGAINRPGALPVLPGMTIRQALVLAGGVSATGSDKKVTVYRGGKEIEANADQTVEKNDVILVKERLF
jgi:polysaccharide export outer membrane protein